MQDLKALEGKSLAELREIAKALGIKNIMIKKRELIAEIAGNAPSEEAAPAEPRQEKKEAEEPRTTTVGEPREKAPRGRRPRLSKTEPAAAAPQPGVTTEPELPMEISPAGEPEAAAPAAERTEQPEPAAQAQTVDAEENDIISVRIKASGELTYGADHKLEIQTTPADAQYIGVVMGTSGQATGYVTLVLSEKIRILLKLIPLPKKMSATPDQTEEFNVYSYLKQLIDGNDVSVLLRVGDEAVSVLNIINFYLPSAYVKTIQNVSNGLKLALDLIRKYLPESAFTRIYLDEQPVDAGGYVAGAVALESGDINSAGVAMFKIKPQTSNVRLYWAGDLPGSLTAEELRNANRNAVLEADGQARSGEGVNISYTYKKKGFLWDKTCDGLPTKPGTYTQVAKVSGNYSCSEISRTFTIYQ